MSDRPEVFVHLLPTLLGPGELRGGVALVVDVLRATTVMVHAVAAGVEAIVPCLEVEEARAAAAALPAGASLLAGERQGLPIPGFELGNSPGDFTPDVCRGKTLVMTTTNGTKAILASLDADRVGIAAMVNAKAVARWALTGGKPVHVVCAGTDGRVSLEDTLLAGELVSRVRRGGGFAYGNDQALIAEAAFQDGLASAHDGASWPDLVARGRGGRRVREIGLGSDVDAAARRNWLDVVPELLRDPLRIVRSDAGGTS